MMNVQAPASVSPLLEKHCEEVSPGHTPVHIDIEPQPGALIDQCFPNAEAMVEKEGGTVEYGWSVFVWPRVWHEFQFHAVWRDRNGVLHDPTPRVDGEKVVLFLPSNQPYTGETLGTRLFSVSKNPTVETLIQTFEEKFQIQIAHSGPEFAGKPIPPDKQRELQEIQMRCEALIAMIDGPPERNDLCPCFSRKKFKNCCGRR